MRIAIISFSQAGEKLAEKVKDALTAETGAGFTVTSAVKSKYAETPLAASLSEWTGARFADSDAILFIGACGIAVRAIAPYIQSKKTDPAVLAADDGGKHVISLLSGHLGGANELTLRIAEILNADPVITTATDNHGKLSPDVFAEKNHCVIDNMKMAKELASSLLAGKKAGLLCRFPTEQNPSGWPQELVPGDWDMPSCSETGIVISPFRKDRGRFAEELWLIPQAVYMGIGCKKGTSEEKIRMAAEEALNNAGIDRRSLAGAATIDLKKEEAGMLEFCRREQLPLHIFTAQQLEDVPGTFTSSDFVKKTAGVDNVCERSALAAAGIEDGEKNEEEPQLLLRKFCRDGVTIALAMKKWRIRI